MKPLTVLFAIIALLPCGVIAQGVDQVVPPAVAGPLEQWRKAVVAGNADSLKQLYSPGVSIVDLKKQPISLADELQFWSSQKLQSAKMDIVKVDPQSGQVRFQVELKEKAASGAKTTYVVAVQMWQGAHIVAETRSPILRLKQPVRLNPKLYDTTADAKEEIREAEARAGREHKRVLLVFGGNWCYDCHVLDVAFHSGDIEPTLDRNYLVVHVDVGEYNKNLDLAEKYQVPLKKGVPAIAVVDPADKLIFSQQGGEFEAARSMSPEQILAFLNKWKPAHAAR